ncbi:hypothetical protein VT84_31050 [Gemmata sp. SH-PL17]|nr:hypothetical protein VT84_31050 [Gemmata sp. SH-PL17]
MYDRLRVLLSGGWSSKVNNKKRLRRAILVSAILVLPLFVVGAAWWVSRTIQSSLLGPVHTFQIANSPPYLTDVLAVEKAKEALALDGYDLSRWAPREDRRSTAPDGTPDIYLARNGINPDNGYVVFERKEGEPSAPRPSVTVELRGNQMTCQVCQPK